MAEQGSGGSSVKMVAIIAILVLVALAGWFFMGQSRQKQSASAPTTEKKADITVDVDLPDTVTIKP